MMYVGGIDSVLAWIMDIVSANYSLFVISNSFHQSSVHFSVLQRKPHHEIDFSMDLLSFVKKIHAFHLSYVLSRERTKYIPLHH